MVGGYAEPHQRFDMPVGELDRRCLYAHARLINAVDVCDSNTIYTVRIFAAQRVDTSVLPDTIKRRHQEPTHILAAREEK
jgi:hypothetical protein